LEAESVPPSLNFLQLDFVEPSSGFHLVTWERVNLCHSLNHCLLVVTLTHLSKYSQLVTKIASATCKLQNHKYKKWKKFVCFLNLCYLYGKITILHYNMNIVCIMFVNYNELNLHEVITYDYLLIVLN
jgi:hypothetical protein